MSGGKPILHVKYRRWHKIQVISCIIYAVLMLLLWWMIYNELSYNLMIATAVIATVFLILSIVSGLIRALIGHNLGIKSTKKDWPIIGIAIILAIIYLAIKHL